MQKQWGLFIGAVGFYVATLGLTYVAGPDPYPRTYSGGRVSTWMSRSAFVENQLVSAAIALGFGMILVLLSLWRPSFRRREYRDYWSAHLPEYRRIMTRMWLRVASICAIGFGLAYLAAVVFPPSTVGRTVLTWVIVVALFVEIFRGVWPLRLTREQRANAAPPPSGASEPTNGVWPTSP
ncbi:Uncharacterised protein (plasmid) [Tsukamurella tyrosinosolvens]|uniref:Uncharacterized protein n=1 Tax=Tsukamurella tyrosinosolvens TaxID=57704 RepID=A0A1H4R5E9_TSUTY|nr:hypothetical protein [Tsukamurella tyrosinosolvens]KXO91409.1 hypothetical protein AXK58_19550 [Tsukamurella tyrosinosolvens]RDB46391.1 hypothetical protein DVB87_18505 [Tsukamurella tyrosinosolvens]SEC26911.1 hypothetical protein SAMN04489793_1937 [Tsukamurella tyrosinosolvens]VEH92256.1 Uncharacterised protein [Tsukamurella tyrosinosolvens]